MAFAKATNFKVRKRLLVKTGIKGFTHRKIILFSINFGDYSPALLCSIENGKYSDAPKMVA